MSPGGEERIANELKLGILVSPRTVGKYIRQGSHRRGPDPQQRWLTFIRNHANVIRRLRLLYSGDRNFLDSVRSVILELAIRRIMHQNVTTHPTDE
jgi:hypothetical protein